MTEEQKFEQFIELCKGVYERLEREGRWPWDETSQHDKDHADD